MAKKRVNGEGTIGKRKDGRWEARYIAGRDPETGKQIRKSILGKTQAEVRAKLREALAEATEIDVVKSGEYNVAGWVQAWYSLYAQPNVRETTARFYKGYIDHHVIPRLGEIPLTKLTSLDMQQFYKDLLENGRIREDTKVKKPGLSSTTVHGIHVMLKSALKRAVQERLISFNPAEFCIPPKITKPELQVIPCLRCSSAEKREKKNPGCKEQSSWDSRYSLILSNQTRFVPSPLASGLASMSLCGGQQAGQPRP